jgi:hypothetical protein
MTDELLRERATRWLAFEADRRAWIARRQRADDVEPEQLIELCARVIGLSLLQQKALSVMLLTERLPYPAEPAFDERDCRIVSAFVERLETLPGDPEVDLGDPMTWFGSLRGSLPE